MLADVTFPKTSSKTSLIEFNGTLEFIRRPWPWYVVGPVIGLTVPTLLLIGNKFWYLLVVAARLRSLSARQNSLFTYDWKKEAWNLFFVAGMLIGGFLATNFLSNPDSVRVAPDTVAALQALGIQDFSGLMPADVFATANLFTVKGLFFFVIGGLLVGFGTRYAGGCTSGHAIMGLSDLQWPSLVATVCFMLGGLAMTHAFLPLIFRLVNL